MEYLILAINPGSISTKIALYKNEEELFKECIDHPQHVIDQYNDILEQVPMRKALVLDALERHGYKVRDLSCVMGRGGLFPPVQTGGYTVNDAMLRMIKNNKIPSHASNLGAVVAHEIAEQADVPAYVYDAVSASDFPPVAQITGMKEIQRKSFYHVLNSRAVGIRYAISQGKNYGDMNLLIAHLGGGITVGVHQKGKIIDSIADDNGPFAPERAGSVPLLDVIDLCYSGKYSKSEMIKKVRGKGGLRDLLGTSDGREIAKRIKNGDEYAALIMEAQAYQIAKGIGLLSPALRGDCDAIILTGGLANDSFLTVQVEKYVRYIAPVIVMPGEYEMHALAQGGLRILRGEEITHQLQYYSS
jgi:butyrate kinase